MDNGNINFDKFIRNKISDIEFSGQKDSWELVNYMLKQRAKTKLRVRLLRYFFSMMVIGAGVGIFLITKTEKKETAGGSVKKQEIEIQLPNRLNSSKDFKRENPEEQKSNEENVLPNVNKKSKAQNVPLAVHSGQSAANDINASEESALPVPDAKIPEESKLSEIDFNTAMNTYAWGSDSFKIEITNTGKTVNSSYADFAPVISADGSTMFFTSRRPVSDKEIKHGKQVMERVYSCSMNSKINKWVNTYVLPNNINVEGRNNSVIGLSADGQRMLLYRDDVFGNGDIYESVLNGDEWSKPELMPEPVNTKYHESSASLSPDGKTLYFVSDRPGGIGGRDIWYCTRDANGKWGKAVNMGSPVNTPQDEEGIFVYSDGKTIYFSSKRHNGLGGYDIYRTVFGDGKWSTPVNMGAPLNTSGDDVYFVLEADGSTGYYTSSRPGGNGEKDIYQVTFLWVKNKPFNSK